MMLRFRVHVRHSAAATTCGRSCHVPPQLTASRHPIVSSVPSEAHADRTAPLQLIHHCDSLQSTIAADVPHQPLLSQLEDAPCKSIGRCEPMLRARAFATAQTGNPCLRNAEVSPSPLGVCSPPYPLLSFASNCGVYIATDSSGTTKWRRSRLVHTPAVRPSGMAFL